MNWLLNNPVSELPGPMFLALYAGLIVLVFVEAAFRSRRADRSRDLGPMPISSKLDPFEIAYLRGGPNEVTRLVVFDLISRGYLRVVEKSKLVTEIEQAPEHPDPDRLSPMELVAFDSFVIPKEPGKLFQAGGLASRIKDGLEPLAQSLHDEQLLTGPERYSSAWRNWLGGAIMILAFGGFKLAVALFKERYNIGFLLIIALIGLVVLGVVCWVPRVTLRGKDYLIRLREAFEGLRPRVLEPSDFLDPALVLVPAVFGVAALAGSPYDYVPRMFRPAASASGSCGGGCGSAGAGCGGGGGGGCGGGGCGGGCGGCGS